MKKKVKRVAFDLDPELFEKLQETVKRKDLDIAKLLRHALREYLAKAA